MKWLGLTGGIGCGKSTALKVFKELGFGVASADEVVHRLYQEESVINEVCEALEIKRNDFSLTNVSNLVFSDKNKLQKLEAVLHPKIRKEVQNIKKSFEELEFGMYEVPLLFEKSLESLFDSTICVGASEEVQLKRIKERNSWSDKEIKSRLSAQFNLEEKKARADFYIDNSGSLVELKALCEELVREL